jgi:hypothetical protein
MLANNKISLVTTILFGAGRLFMALVKACMSSLELFCKVVRESNVSNGKSGSFSFRNFLKPASTD